MWDWVGWPILDTVRLLVERPARRQCSSQYHLYRGKVTPHLCEKSPVFLWPLFVLVVERKESERQKRLVGDALSLCVCIGVWRAISYPLSFCQCLSFTWHRLNIPANWRPNAGNDLDHEFISFFLPSYVLLSSVLFTLEHLFNPPLTNLSNSLSLRPPSSFLPALFQANNGT